MTRRTKKIIKKVAWGFFWLLLASLILANYFGGFVNLGLVSVIVSALALVILFHCIASLSFAAIPIPIAALYYIFQAPLDLPFVDLWVLIPVTLLLTIGLFVLLPRKFGRDNIINVNINNDKRERKYKVKESYVNAGNIKVILDDEDDMEVIVVDTNNLNNNESDTDNNDSNGKTAKSNSNPGNTTESNEKTKIEENDDENNPYISVSFGHVSRYLHADCLESAELACNFGGMEVYFDNVTLSPEGAEVSVNCNFGSMEIFVPPHWRVIDDINSSLANAEISRKLQSNDPSSPTITITGSVSLGNVEVKRLRK